MSSAERIRKAEQWIAEQRDMDIAKTKRDAEKMVAVWKAGDRDRVDNWIGNSATRMLAFLDRASAVEGSEYCRVVLLNLGVKRGF